MTSMVPRLKQYCDAYLHDRDKMKVKEVTT